MNKIFKEPVELVLQMIPKNRSLQSDYYPMTNEDLPIIVNSVDDGIDKFISAVNNYIKDFGEDAPYGGDMSAQQVKEKLLNHDYELEFSDNYENVVMCKLYS